MVQSVYCRLYPRMPFSLCSELRVTLPLFFFLIHSSLFRQYCQINFSLQVFHYSWRIEAFIKTRTPELSKSTFCFFEQLYGYLFISLPIHYLMIENKLVLVFYHRYPHPHLPLLIHSVCSSNRENTFSSCGISSPSSTRRLS